MGIHIRRTPIFAVVGVLALGAASAAAAQDTSAAARKDTSGYQQSGNQTDTSRMGGNAARSDTSGYQSTGAPTDTALKAKPGVKTGPALSDTGQMHHRRHQMMKMSEVDTVVCKDGQNAPNEPSGACSANGGVDTAATWAALKARGTSRSSP